MRSRAALPRGRTGALRDAISGSLKAEYIADKRLEFLWDGSPSQGSSDAMWTHVMDSHYGTPAECAYDGGLFIQSDPRLPTLRTNFVAQGEAFVSMARTRSGWYRHNNILIPFGNDFSHQAADFSFKQVRGARGAFAIA